MGEAPRLWSRDGLDGDRSGAGRPAPPRFQRLRVGGVGGCGRSAWWPPDDVGWWCTGRDERDCGSRQDVPFIIWLRAQLVKRCRVTSRRLRRLPARARAPVSGGGRRRAAAYKHSWTPPPSDIAFAGAPPPPPSHPGRHDHGNQARAAAPLLSPSSCRSSPRLTAGQDPLSPHQPDIRRPSACRPCASIGTRGLLTTPSASRRQAATATSRSRSRSLRGCLTSSRRLFPDA